MPTWLYKGSQKDGSCRFSSSSHPVTLCDLANTFLNATSCRISVASLAIMLRSFLNHIGRDKLW